MQSNTNQIKLAIKLNSRSGDLCPLCGAPTKPRIGLEVVEDSSDLPVCGECAVEHGLELAYAVSMIEASRLLAISELNFGVKFEDSHFPEAGGGVSWEENFDENLTALEVAR